MRASLPQCRASSAGPEVASLIGTTGRVLAVTGRAVYLCSLKGYVVGIVDSEGEDGPLTLRVPGFAQLGDALAADPCVGFQASPGALTFHNGAQVHWADTRQWVPPLPRPTAALPAQHAAAARLAGAIVGQGPSEGAGGLVAEAPQATPLLRRLAAGLDAFHRAWAAGDLGRAARALTGLLGLGPGLTPSGDDLVAGLLAMLVWRACATPVGDPGTDSGSPCERIAALVAAVRDAAPRRTNVISARLLWHASAGVLYAPAMDLGAALLGGDSASVEDAARRLFAIGATTGVDMAVGLLAGLVADGSPAGDRFPFPAPALACEAHGNG